jgi:hypothetical protein
VASALRRHLGAPRHEAAPQERKDSLMSQDLAFPLPPGETRPILKNTPSLSAKNTADEPGEIVINYDLEPAEQPVAVPPHKTIKVSLDVNAEPGTVKNIGNVTLYMTL